jgi:hypothetical protein
MRTGFRAPELFLGILLAAFLFGMGFVAGSSQRSTQEQRKPDAFWGWLSDKPEGFFALWLTLVAAGQLLMFGVQLKLMRDTQQENIEHLKATQRAYLSVEGQGIHSLKYRPESVAHIAIRNSGRLPAGDVRWAITHAFSPNRDRTEFPLPATEGSVVLPSQGKMLQGGPPITFSIELDTDPLVSPRYLYVWGVVTYHDGFNPDRTIEFCHRYNCINAERDTNGGYSIPAGSVRHNRYGNRQT